MECSIFLALAPAMLARERAVCSCWLATAFQNRLVQHLAMAMFSPLMRDGRWTWAVSMLRAVLVKVLVEWGREGDAFDVETHVVKRTVGFNVLDAVSGEPAPGFTPVNAVLPARVFTAPEIDIASEDEEDYLDDE